MGTPHVASHGTMRRGNWIVPEAQRWHQAVKDVEVARNTAEQLHREAVAHKDAEVDRWRKTCKTMQANRDVAEAKLQDVEVDALRKVNDIQWASVRQATEYEDRIRALEKLLEEERLEHARERERQEELAKKACAEAAARVEEAETRCQASIAAADARAREAVETMESAVRRSADEVARARTREEGNVALIRKQADERVRSIEEKLRQELHERHHEVVQRQRAMEESLYMHGRPKSEGLWEARQFAAAMDQESLYMHGRPKSEGLWEARQFAAAMDQDMTVLRLAQSPGQAIRSDRACARQDMKELRLAQSADQAIKSDRACAPQELLGLEKALHARTADRLASRLAQTSAREGDLYARQELGLRTRPRPWHDLASP
uniref:Uncharacterized protein n=1 Tax=Alexandrium monilatum TaxID=311494 RepID=A0A7S4PUW0_9DINO